MKKVGFWIQKGGVGKTTLSGHVAYASSNHVKTILIDGDPQGNLTAWFMKKPSQHDLANILYNEIEIEKAIVKVSNNFYLLPTYTNGNLQSYAEKELDDRPYIFEDLTNRLEDLGFDLAIFDMSPGFNRLEKRIMMALDEIITPMKAEYFSVEGIQLFKDNLQKFNKNYRKDVAHKKIAINEIEGRTRAHRTYSYHLTKLPYSVFMFQKETKLREAQGIHKSIFEYNPESTMIPELNRLTKIIIGEGT